MTNPEEAWFKFDSKVLEKKSSLESILYFPISYEETNLKLRKHSFQVGDRITVRVELKKRQTDG